MSYTEVTISGYNSSPPSDDGSQTANNQATWAAIKTKLADPIKTALETVDDRVAAAIAITDVYPTTWAAGDDTVLSTLRAELNAPSGTAMVFVQTSAPTGWTKQSTHDNKALRLVTGTASTGGSTNFTSVFTSRTIAQANLPVVNWTHSLTAATHTHTGPSHTHSTPTHSHGAGTYAVGTSITNGTSVIRGTAATKDEGDSSTFTTVTGASSATLSLASGTVSGSSATDGSGTTGAGGTGDTGASGALAISGTVSSGGSGTALDFAVQYVDVIYATKN